MINICTFIKNNNIQSMNAIVGPLNKFVLNVKLLTEYVHLKGQNKPDMTSPPTNEREFASLIKEHSRTINKVSYFYATDKVPFEDLRQEIYVNIWQSMKQFRGDSKISTWIYRVAVNAALMAIRSTKRKPETISLECCLPDISTEIDDEQREKLQMLYASINKLEDIEKAIILLWLDEYSYDEIADTMGMKRNTVAIKIHRIKEKLSKSL